LRNNALRRRVSGRFFGDNPVVGWDRYGLDSVAVRTPTLTAGLWAADRNAGDNGAMRHVLNWPANSLAQTRRGMVLDANGEVALVAE
jgi:hypothetical protein